mmetsp:Transcript_10933/g.24489  ORF Transcript_10933/g.24489 Transcript_10933/m.24489 type:complete len:301 (-) Transcript_10933:1288-2190(-)
MLELEGQVSSPCISEARVQGHSTVEPFPGLSVLAVTPEELGHSDDDVSIVLTFLQSINALGILALLGLQLDSFCPQHAACGALLQSSAHEVVCQTFTSIQHLDFHSLLPEEVSPRVSQAALLEQGSGLRVLLLPNLALHGAQPERDASRAFLQATLEELGSLVQLRGRFLHVDLPPDHPHFCKGWMLLETLFAQVKSLLEKTLFPLQLHRLHPDLRSVTLLSSPGQQQPATLNLVILAFQLHGCQVDSLGLLRVTEGLGQDSTGCGHISAQPLLLRGHEPEDLCMRAVGHCTLQYVVERL